MSQAEKLYEQWCKQVPKEARCEDVELVAQYFLGNENIRTGKTGSHSMIIDGPLMKIAYQLRDKGASEFSRLTGDTYTIPRVNGRAVKQVYLQVLLRLIELKKMIDAERKKQK